MLKCYISIISHGNDDDIINNHQLKKINGLEFYEILIRDNTKSEQLKSYCLQNNFKYFRNNVPCGFGENNNLNYNESILMGMVDEDFFIVFNPDVTIDITMMNQLYNLLKKKKHNIFAINLFSDLKFLHSEASLRKFPSIYSFVNPLLGKSFNSPYDKLKLNNYDFVDWAAGSFLIFRSSLYKKLDGFNVNYFMYFEDVDLCFRALNKYQENVMFLKDIKATHIGGYQNRDVLSPHFRWYFASLLRFLLNKYKYKLKCLLKRI